MKVNVYKNDSQREYQLTDMQREEYRRIARESREAKLAASQGLMDAVHGVNTPNLDPNQLMPQLESNHLRTISLFSGGGGLDLGFDKAGYEHVASYELIPICGETLSKNRPEWKIYSGPHLGDVTEVDWTPYRGLIDVIHGGPPCQPFSIAGSQKGADDERNMWGEFIRAINTIKPRAFVAENVLGLLNPKFEGFVKSVILDNLNSYHIKMFEMNAADFGVPQIRRRVFFVGFSDKSIFDSFSVPNSTHTWLEFKESSKKQSLLFQETSPRTMGVREALGLSEISYDNLAPTLRSGFTGKRNTTSILNSTAGQKAWGDLGIWPNGIQLTRNAASNFPAKHNHFRLSVQDCAILQGFPEDWHFAGAVYQILGQIGNSVCPPVAYQVAKKVANLLQFK